MDNNPYAPPEALESKRVQRPPFSVVGGLVLILASTATGAFLGVLAGFGILTVTPREVTGGCGNTILDPAMLGGLFSGFACGCIRFVWKVLRSS